jgi:phospholipid/cholesterol/gamma-HCH transport system substrate-binding protein
METRANYVLIGVFTVAVIAGGFLFVLWFTGLGKTTQHSVIEVVFTGSVSGLSRGSLTTFNGLRVGEVTSIDFLPKDPTHVSALVEIDERTPINSATTARIESQGLTGVAQLALTGGVGAAPLAPGPNGGPPIIYAERSDFQNLLENAQRISAKADDVLAKISKLIDDNSESVSDTLHNADKFSKALADNSDGVKDFLASVSDLGQKIGPLADKLQGLSADVDNVVKAVDPDKVRNVVGNVDAFIATLAQNKEKVESALADAASLAKRLNASSEKLDGALDNLSTFSSTLANNKSNVDSLLTDAAALAKRLGGTSEKLDAALDRINELARSIDPDKVRDVVGNVDTFSATLANNKANIDGLLADAASLAKRLNGTSEKLDATLDQIYGVAKSLDRAKIAGVVDDISSVADTLKENRGNIDRTLKDAAELVAKLDNSADQLDGLMRSLQGFVGSPETKGAVAQIGDAANSVRQLAENLDQRTKEIATGLIRFSGPGLREYEALAIEGRRAVTDLDHLVRSLDRNPSQIIWGAKPGLPEYHGGQ